MERTMFTHDNTNGTAGYSTTTQYKCFTVSILVKSEALSKCPVSDTVFTSKKCFRQTNLGRTTGEKSSRVKD